GRDGLPVVRARVFRLGCVATKRGEVVSCVVPTMMGNRERRPHGRRALQHVRAPHARPTVHPEDTMTRPASGAFAARDESGSRLRRKTPREKHADLAPAKRDPVAILAAGDKTRVPELVPERYRRMLISPFTFLRGAAAVMAQDLKHEPMAGIAV